MMIRVQAKNNGIFLGVILVVFTMVLSFVNPLVFLRTKSFLLIVPFFIVLIKNAFDLRRANEGFINFKELFLQSFFCSSIAILICSTFEYFLFNNIYPEMVDMYRQVSREALEQSADLFGDEFVEKNMETIENQDLFGITQIISLFFTRLLTPGALLSLITAILFKKPISKLIKNE